MLAKIAGHDGHELRRLRVDPLSARMVELAAMLKPDEDEREAAFEALVAAAYARSGAVEAATIGELVV